MKLKSCLSAILTVAMAASLSACGGSTSGDASASASQSSTASKDSYTVGICQYMEHPALDKATEGFEASLTELLGKDKVKFDVQNAQGEQTNCPTIVTKFVSDGVDLIMANATPAAQAAHEATADIPIIGTSVTDYVAAGLVASNDKPGGNLTGASDLNPVDVQVELMQKLCPTVKTVGIVICSAEQNSQVQADEAKKAFESKGYTVKVYTAADSNELQSVFTKACSEVDGFYEPTDNLVANNMELVKNVTVPAKKPVIVAEEGMCKTGGLATYSIDYYQLGYEAGKQAAEILKDGKKPADIPIYHFDTESLKLVVNEDLAKQLGITIPADLKK